MFAIRMFVVTFVVSVTVTVDLQHPEEVRYKWKYLNYTWTSPQQYHNAVANGEYIPENNAFTGIKFFRDYMYLAVPRLRYGVPATLVRIPINPVNGNRSPNLEPYPNWEMQKIGDCNALQSVPSLEIDELGQMVILDNGHNGYLEGNECLCPPRLMILDANNGTILVDYKFPPNVVNPETLYLNDIVIDNGDGGYAFITNTDKEKPSIVVFSLAQRTSWSILHWSMHPRAPIIKVKNDNETVSVPYGIDGIAMSAASKEGDRLVYYTSLSSYQLFSIPSDVLKNNPRHFTARMRVVGKKPSQTDGMIITANNELYFGLLADNRVSKWNPDQRRFNRNQQRVYEDDDKLMWPSNFAIDDMKNLYVITNRAEKLLTTHYDINRVNFRVVRLTQLNYLNYQYYENGSIPEPPIACIVNNCSDKL